MFAQAISGQLWNTLFHVDVTALEIYLRINFILRWDAGNWIESEKPMGPLVKVFSVSDLVSTILLYQNNMYMCE